MDCGNTENQRLISFSLGGMLFEYDPVKNDANIKKHGISFKNAARVFFDYDRIEMYDDDNRQFEARYDTIGDLRASDFLLDKDIIIGDVGRDDIIFVVYTERTRKAVNGTEIDVTRIISARYATSFERGLYYGKY